MARISLCHQRSLQSLPWYWHRYWYYTIILSLPSLQSSYNSRCWPRVLLEINCPKQTSFSHIVFSMTLFVFNQCFCFFNYLVFFSFQRQTRITSKQLYVWLQRTSVCFLIFIITLLDFPVKKFILVAFWKLIVWNYWGLEEDDHQEEDDEKKERKTWNYRSVTFCWVCKWHRFEWLERESLSMSQITLFFLKQQKQQGKHEEGEENDDDSKDEGKEKKWMSMKIWRDIHLVIPAVCDLQRLITF